MGVQNAAARTIAVPDLTTVLTFTITGAAVSHLLGRSDPAWVRGQPRAPSARPSAIAPVARRRYSEGVIGGRHFAMRAWTLALRA